jgi:hypothetical protein
MDGFVAYIGGPEVHDASVIRCHLYGKDLHVLVKSERGVSPA